MKPTRRKLMMIGLCALFFMGIPMVVTGLARFWEREYTGNEFHFHYENFLGFVSNTWETYQSKTEVIELLNGLTMITVTENTYLDSLAMDVTFTSTAGGLGLNASGQYVELSFNTGVGIIVDAGDPFVIPTDGSSFNLDISAMEWANCYESGVIGHALEITFTIDQSGITETETGDYTYDIMIGIGTE